MVVAERNLAANKRIIVCCDGTWLSSDLGDNSVPSNVAKLARALAPNGLNDAGEIFKQIVFYQSGLGSGDLPLQKAIFGEHVPKVFEGDLRSNKIRLNRFVSQAVWALDLTMMLRSATSSSRTIMSPEMSFSSSVSPVVLSLLVPLRA